MEFNNDIWETVKRVLDHTAISWLPEGIRKSPVAVLEDARCWFFPVNDPEKGPEYQSRVERLDSICDEIADLLPDDGKELIEELKEVYAFLEEMNVRHSYRLGLRDGFLLIVELLLKAKQRAGKRDGKKVAESGK